MPLNLPPEWTEGDVAILAEHARRHGNDPADVLARRIYVTYEQAQAILMEVEKKAGAR